MTQSPNACKLLLETHLHPGQNPAAPSVPKDSVPTTQQHHRWHYSGAVLDLPQHNPEALRIGILPQHPPPPIGSTQPRASHPTHQANPPPTPALGSGLSAPWPATVRLPIISRLLPKDVGNRTSRAIKRILTKLQGKKGLLGRRTDALRGSQDALIFWEVSGKSERQWAFTFFERTHQTQQSLDWQSVK